MIKTHNWFIFLLDCIFLLYRDIIKTYLVWIMNLLNHEFFCIIYLIIDITSPDTLHYIEYSPMYLIQKVSPVAAPVRLHESWMTLFKICFSLQKKLDCIKEQTFDSIININPTLFRIFYELFSFELSIQIFVLFN